MRFARLIACGVMAAGLAACAAGTHAVLPAVTGASASQMETAPSRSPATFAIPPMGGLDAASRVPMTTRKPQSGVSALTFTQLAGAAVFVAASPDGSFWVLSTNGLPTGDKFIYHYVNGTYVNVPGAATRLAVGPDNTVWALNAAGGIYYLNSSGAFIGIAGGASEISVAVDSSVYVISNQPGSPVGRGIYRYASGAWTQLPGAGITIAASIDSATYANLSGVNGSRIFINPDGFYVANAQGGIFYYNPGSGFVQLAGGAIALAPTASGGLFALGDPGAYQHGIYYNDLTSGQWNAMPGAAVSLSANSAYVYAVGTTNGIYRSPISVLPNGSLPATLDGSGFPYPYTPGSTVAVPASTDRTTPMRLPDRRVQRLASGATVMSASANEPAPLSSSSPYYCGASLPANCYHYANGFINSAMTNGVYAVQSFDTSINVTDANTFYYAPTIKGGGDCLEITVHYLKSYGTGILYGANVSAWDWCDNPSSANGSNGFLNGIPNFNIVNYIKNAKVVVESFRDGGSIWHAIIFNFSTGNWDELYNTAYDPEQLDPIYTYSWDIFEQYASSCAVFNQVQSANVQSMDGNRQWKPITSWLQQVNDPLGCFHYLGTTQLQNDTGPQLFQFTTAGFTATSS